jgi:hypothetical protein
VEPLGGRLGAVCTGRASGISRQAVKWGCACEWGGWGRLSEEGAGQKNPDWREGPWGRAAEAARTEVHQRATSPAQNGEPTREAGSRKDGGKPSDAREAPNGKALSEIPALKPYWGKPAVGNFREGNRNVGMIRSPRRAIALPDRGGRHCQDDRRGEHAESAVPEPAQAPALATTCEYLSMRKAVWSDERLMNRENQSRQTGLPKTDPLLGSAVVTLAS